MEWRLLLWSACLFVVATRASAKDLPEMCPCLPANLCPHAYGSSTDDMKYLGEFKKCATESEVRCCGASMSQEVNTDGGHSRNEDDNRFQRDNEIEDVRMEHLTIPPSVEEITTTEAPQEDDLPMTTTAEPVDETTVMSGDVPQTTTVAEEDEITEAPAMEVTPRFGKNVQFVYAVSPEEYFGSQRQAKKLSFGSSEEQENTVAANDVFVIMPQTFLADEAANEIEASEPLTTTTPAPAVDDGEYDVTTTATTTVEPELSMDEVTMIPTTTEGQLDEDEFDEEINMPTTTTETPTTTTKRPLIRKRIRVKVRRGFKLLPKLSEKDLQQELAAENAGVEAARKSRNSEEQPKAKINHSLYTKRKNTFKPKSLRTTTTKAPEANTALPLTTVAPTPAPTKQSPAALKILAASVEKRRNLFQKRANPLKSSQEKEKPQAEEVVVVAKPVVQVPTDNMKKIEGQHQQMIEQVLKSVGEQSMMSTFDVADQMMDPEVAAKIARMQKSLAGEMLAMINGKQTATTEEVVTTVATENPIDAIESKQGPPHPYRGSKRYIETNFLNAYENVIHKVEEKIKTHKGPVHRPHPAKIVTTTTTPRPVTTPPPHHVQILLSSPSTPETVTEDPETLETITEIIEKLEDIERLEFSDADAFRPSLGLDVNPASAAEDQSDQLSEPIDLLGRRRRTLRGSRRFSVSQLSSRD